MSKITIDNVEVYTVDEAASKLGYSSITIWRKIKDKVFTSIKWANRTYISCNQIDEFLANSKVETGNK